MFDTELVGTVKGPIRCSGGMRVVLDRTLAQAAVRDMVFVPGGAATGGGVDLVSMDRRVLKLLRSAERQGKAVWSVCTGSLVLGSAGLLSGRRAVTQSSYLYRLDAQGAKVVRRRTVSDGKITTRSGISSSIDVGLELVRRTLGKGVAREVQRRMEYHSPASR